MAVQTPESVGMTSEPLLRIRGALEGYVRQGLVPCAQAIVFRRGHVVLAETLGWSSIERRAPLRADAIFRLYSMTKPVVGVAVMMLHQAGQLGLHDPVAAYLPEFASMQVLCGDQLVAAKRPITLHDLLTHTAGLSYHFLLDDKVAPLYQAQGLLDNWTVQASGMPLAAYVTKLASLPLRAHPGTQWCYSEAMNVLGRVVEAVSKERFGTFVKRRILDPLHMKDTDFHVSPERKERLVEVYEVAPEGSLLACSDRLGFDHPPSADFGGSGLVGTAADYLRFARMLLNGGELEGVRLLDPDMTKRIVTNHLGPEFGERPLHAMPGGLWAEPGVGHGYCGVVVKDPKARGIPGSAGEYSWAGAANTNFWVDFAQELIVIVMSQVFPGESRARDIHDQVRALVYEAIPSGDGRACGQAAR